MRTFVVLLWIGWLGALLLAGRAPPGSRSREHGRLRQENVELRRRVAGLQARAAAVVRVAGFPGGRIVIGKRALQPDTTPLMSHDLQAALEDFDAERDSLADAASRAEARANLDRALDALDRARDALWDTVEHPERRGAEGTEAQTVQALWRAFAQSAVEDQPPAFLGGAVGEALVKLDKARQKLGRAGDERAAFRALDDAVRALMWAHRKLIPFKAPSRR